MFIKMKMKDKVFLAYVEPMGCVVIGIFCFNCGEPDTFNLNVCCVSELFLFTFYFASSYLSFLYFTAHLGRKD